MDGEAWYEVYRYDDVVTLGASTTALICSLAMFDISFSDDYAKLFDLNVIMTGYACGAEDGETLDTAWDIIKVYGL